MADSAKKKKERKGSEEEIRKSEGHRGQVFILSQKIPWTDLKLNCLLCAALIASREELEEFRMISAVRDCAKRLVELSMFSKQIATVLGRFACVAAVTMAQKRSHGVYKAFCQRLANVTGNQGKQNDVIVCGSVQTAKQHIVFMGGDVQDYKENMAKYNDKYQDWDLETTAQLIQTQFVDSAVFVIKPACMFLNTFSIYENFLSFDEEAKPQFTEENKAFLHLKKLYENARNSASSKDSREKQSKGEASCDRSIPIKIIGFSKGCVVVNQMVFGLKPALETDELKPFLNQIAAIYWLDGGHIGGSNAYITDDEILNTLVAWDKDLFVNVTPYQVRDPMRKWIGQEEKEFVSKLKEMKAKITENRHFMRVPGSIDKHFEILKIIH